ncbi:MAG: signal recognition particle-docking protein FtsY, partial [Nitrospinota bacterium]
GDTFRAAAIEQLEVWAERVGCDLIKNQQGSDSAALVFDSIDAAIARGKNILIVDTAGRLHNKGNLMNELLKIKKIIDKKANNIANESLLVLDATTGQNGLNQAVEFSENIGITGIILTKLDGVAKGGVLFNIVDRLKLPIKYIGVGEAIEDLQLFNPSEFVEQIFQ